MTYLLLSICFSSSLYIIFKLYGRYDVHNLHAIIVNYLVAFPVGLVFSNKTVSIADITTAGWLPGVLVLGLLFIAVFLLLAATTRQNGVVTASVASKMSVVISVAAGFWLYNESAGGAKITGIALAMAAVYLVSQKNGGSFSGKYLLYPALLFFGAGLVDSSLKYMEFHYVPDAHIPLFTASIFGSCALFGICYTLVKKTGRLRAKSIIAGFALGVPNFFSIYFLLKSLSVPDMESSTVFTVNNVGIVALSSLLGVVLFKEKLSKLNALGIAAALLSIFLVLQ